MLRIIFLCILVSVCVKEKEKEVHRTCMFRCERKLFYCWYEIEKERHFTPRVDGRARCQEGEKRCRDACTSSLMVE